MGDKDKNREKHNIIVFVGLLLAAVFAMSGCASELSRVLKTPGTSVSAAVPWVPWVPPPGALGLGAGAESRQPLGLAVVGGLLFSQFLTLVVTPVFYVYMDQFQSFLTRRFKRRSKTSDYPVVDESA